MIDPVEHIAQVLVGRAEGGTYHVRVKMADGTEVVSDGWATVTGALEAAWPGHRCGASQAARCGRSARAGAVMLSKDDLEAIRQRDRRWAKPGAYLHCVRNTNAAQAATDRRRLLAEVDLLNAQLEALQLAGRRRS